jgi:Tol biopolymer transport system component
MEVLRLLARRWRLACVVAVLAAIGASASAAAPRRSAYRLPAWAARGFLVYRCDDALCLAEPGKTRVRWLDFTGPAPQWDPAVSPDGKAVAFRGYYSPFEEGDFALYVVGTNGCTPRRVTRTTAALPSWAPGGKWIVFESGGFWKVRSNGTGLTRLGRRTGQQEAWPSWSPSGNEIAFVRFIGGRGQIWVMKANGTQPVELRASMRASYEQPSWSKNGKRIAFVARSGERSWIEVMNADGSHLRRVTSRGGYAWNPVWLPRDAGIAWLAGYGGSGSVFAARANGTHVTRVLRAQAEEFAWSSTALPRRGCWRTLPRS